MHCQEFFINGFVQTCWIAATIVKYGKLLESKKKKSRFETDIEFSCRLMYTSIYVVLKDQFYVRITD